MEKSFLRLGRFGGSTAGDIIDFHAAPADDFDPFDPVETRRDDLYLYLQQDGNIKNTRGATEKKTK